MKVKKLMWAYLLKHGTTKEFSYYGSGYSNYEDHVQEADLKVFREISRDGVDWDKTKEPADEMESQFNGTFDDAINISVLQGTLVTLKGKEHDFGTNWDEHRNVFAMFDELSDLNFEAELKKRCLGST